LTTRRVDYNIFNNLDVQILGISVDDTFSQMTFADSLGLPFPLLSDSDAEVTRLYAAEKLVKAGTDLTPVMMSGKGITLNQDRIIATQAFYLIDKQGILRGRWLPGREHMTSEKILDMVRRLQSKS
jgi:peroxiredoxin